MTAHALRLIGVGKRFGASTIFADVNLDVAPGDRIAILGASGSGKSTLLRCVNFLEVPDEGRVELNGKLIGNEIGPSTGIRYDPRELQALRQRVGMVFQQFNLFPHMRYYGANAIRSESRVPIKSVDDLRTQQGRPLRADRPQEQARDNSI